VAKRAQIVPCVSAFARQLKYAKTFVLTTAKKNKSVGVDFRYEAIHLLSLAKIFS